ncbi:MAG: VOC family protein [Candidatus Nitrosopolaris sp.]
MADITHPAAPAPFMSGPRRKGHMRNVFDIISYRTTMIQKITPFLWFDHDAEEGAKFYISIFKNSKIIDTTSYGKSAAATYGPSKASSSIGCQC